MTQTQILSTLSLAHTQFICLDTYWQSLSNEESHNPLRPVFPENLMYVIYTSGSTGKPKGAMNTHRGLCNRLCWMQHTYQLTGRDRVLQKSPLSFDGSVWEVFWPWLSGACLIVATPGGHRDPNYLKALMVEQQLATLNFVPSMLQAFLQEFEVSFSGNLRQMICGGEALSPELQARFFAIFPDGVQLHNLYGPTEVSIGVTFWPCHREDARYPVPIGRPIANTQIYLLDQNLQLVPVGVKAELYIGGVGVARGYWRRPELTAERFIADPFSRVLGARLYRTGDLARYRGDGTLEFLGRVDQQVKLRGYRIELGEIETVLAQHETIQECVVLAQEDESREKRLVAYLVVKPGLPLTMREIRSYLQERLPAYMLPSAFVLLDALPLTANGKIDKRGLAVLEASQGDMDRMEEEARTPIEDLLVGIFCEVLSYHRGSLSVGIHENFFELGGHSLLATRLIARLRTVFAVEVPLRAVFEAPTVAGLARLVEQVVRENQGIPFPPLVKVARPEEIPLSFAQQRLWFLDQLQPGSTAYLVPQARHLHGPLETRALERSLEELVRRHESLRTTFTAHAGQPMQVIHPVGTVSCACPLPLIDLRGLEPERKRREVRQLVRQEAQRPCDLEHGPLLRTYLLQLDHNEHVLLLTLHHIITDGWSNRVLRQELVSLYQANVSGQPSPLAPLPLQYADYAIWHREWLQGEVLEAKLDYWTRRLAGVPPLELPTDYPRPSVTSSRGATHHFVLSQDLTQALHVLSRKAGVTLFMVLLAAFNVLFYRSTGQSDIVVGTDSANRQHVETEGIIGFFVNLLALRTNLSGKPTFREVMERVREGVLGAYTHQDMPFELLVEKLAPDHYLDRTPLIQALFVLQNIALESAKEEDIVPHVERETVDQASFRSKEDKEAEETLVKFDLAVVFGRVIQDHLALTK